MGFSHKLFSISIYALSIMSLLAVVIGPLIMIPFTTLWWNIENIRGSSVHASDASLFPNGVIGVLKCLPTAIWCFLGFEGVTMLSQETREFQKSGPRIMYWIMASVSLSYALQVIICPLVPPGVTTADGFRETILSISLSKIYPQQSVIIISLYSFLQKLVGLFASVYVLSRQLISVSNQIALLVLSAIFIILPHVITKTRYLSKSGKILSQTIPWFALIFEVIWVLVTAAIQYALPLTPISVFIKTGGSFIFLSYLRLRLVAPFHRPVKVPIVIPCAITGLCIAFTTFGVMAADESYRISCLICIFKLVVECAVYIGYQWVLRRRRRRGRVNVLVFSSDDILNVQDYNI
ncbi:hypothetical protein BDR26DRAFT_872011 [Obelidium mucronatum]|nr:hypothetical protein BDR26DRAFT_872011 [Obelidium mucronatum]